MVRDLTKLAAAYAAGTMTHAALVDYLGGDGDLVDQVVGIAGGLGAAGMAIQAVDVAFDVAEELPIIGDVVSFVDDIF